MTASKRELLSAYLDGELSAAETAEVERAIRDDEAVRRQYEALESTQATLGEIFRESIAAAPPPPASLAGESERNEIAWLPWLTGIGIAAAIAIAAWLGGRDEAERDPESHAAAEPKSTEPGSTVPQDVVRRAAKRFRELRDAELLVTMESEAIDLLKKLLDRKEPQDEKETRFHYRMRVKAPKLFAFYEVRGRNGRDPIVGGDACGCDGVNRWSYDPDQDEVVLYPPDGPGPALRWSVKSSSVTTTTTTIENGHGAKDLLQCLSFGFLQEIEANDASFTFEEITGPSDERVARRVFRVRRVSDTKSDWVTDAIELTVDPRRDLIERIRFDVKLSMLSLITFTVDLVATNRGLLKRDFEPQRYVAKTTVVRDATAEELKKASASEKSDK